MYEIYQIAKIPFFIGISFFVGLFSVIIIINLFFSKSKSGGFEDIKTFLKEFNIKKPIAIIFCLLSSAILVFSNNTIVWLLSGQKDLRLAPEGTYCYYVIASKESSNKEYTLPAKVEKGTSDLYYVKNVYFPNGGYLYFDSGDYYNFGKDYDYNNSTQCFNETMYYADQNGEFWNIILTGRKTTHSSVYEQHTNFTLNIILTILFSGCLIIISIILIKLPKE